MSALHATTPGSSALVTSASTPPRGTSEHSLQQIEPPEPGNLESQAIQGLLTSTVVVQRLIAKLSDGMGRETKALRHLELLADKVVQQLRRQLNNVDSQRDSGLASQLAETLALLTEVNHSFEKVCESLEGPNLESTLEKEVSRRSWLKKHISRRRNPLSDKDQRLLKSHLDLTYPLMEFLKRSQPHVTPQEITRRLSIYHEESFEHDANTSKLLENGHFKENIMTSSSKTNVTALLDTAYTAFPAETPTAEATSAALLRASLATETDIRNMLVCNSTAHERHKQVRLSSPLSCLWFISSKPFHEWRYNESVGTFWCIGEPGIGKSTIISTVIDSMSFFGDTPSAYFYLGCGGRRQYALEVVDCLLFQLCEKKAVRLSDLPTTAEIAALPKENRPSPLETILAYMQDLSEIEYFSKSVILMDGWDRLNMEDPENFSKVLDALVQLPWKLFITFCSTDTPMVDFRYGDRYFEVTPEHLREDHYRWVMRQIASNYPIRKLFGELSRDDSEQMDLQDFAARDIVDRANGIFIWCKLRTVWLLGQKTVGNLRNAINNPPRFRTQIIAGLLGLVDSQRSPMKETGRRTLIWLAKSFMPMSVDGLCETLALQPTNEVNDDSASERHSLIPTADEIVKCCKSLATIGYGSTTLVLVDAEIAEHLEFHWKEEYSIERTRLAQVCLKYLMSDTSLRGVCDRPETLSERLRSYSFLNYAASCWSKHALEAEQETRDLAVRFLSHKYYRESALQIYLSNENPRKLSFEVIRNVASSMSALQVATRAGLTECIDSLLESTEENNLLSADTEGRTVFHEAMETGNTRTFFKLLGIILDEYSKRIQEDPTYCRPLPNTFGFEDQDPFFKYALSHGYDYLSHGLKISALKIAIKRNNFTALVALLSLRSSDWSPEAKSISLHLAVHHGFTDLVAVILQYGAEINPKPPTQPVLLKAIALGSKPMVDLLVLYGADVNVQWEGQTPLLEAIEKKHFRIIKVLLEWDADIRALNADQKGVLHVAAASRNLDLVELLLHFGADVSHRDLDGKTALFVAVENGDQDIATLLLEYGVDSMAKSSTTGQTVLHEAVKRGDKHMVFLLLDHCGSFTSSDWQDSDGRTPLEVARLEHNDELARILEEDL